MNEININAGDIQAVYSRKYDGDIKSELKSAFALCSRLHESDLRSSGEPYLYHPLRVARMTAEWGFDRDVILASIFHDIPDTCGKEYLPSIAEEFGGEVSSLVEAVSALSDKGYTGHREDEAPPDAAGPALPKTISLKALYIKIADRIDVLSLPAEGSRDRLVLKAGHTRDVIIPLVEQASAFHFMDVLEELVFPLLNPERFSKTAERFCCISDKNAEKLRESLSTLSRIFDPDYCYSPTELGSLHRYIADFQYHERSYTSIYRQLCQPVDNIEKDFTRLFTKSRIALYDLVLVVSDTLARDLSLTPEDIFFRYYEAALEPKGFYLVDYRESSFGDSHYFLIADDMDNLFRLFIRTEREYQRFLFGRIIDEDSSLDVLELNEYDPREVYTEKIKVFRRDGSAMYIEKGATVLDFAFAIHTEIGYHFKSASIDNSRSPLPAYTRLSAGDKVTIETDENIQPSLNWFKYVRTGRATNFLVHYFQHLPAKSLS